jgi:hypothetical protein
MFGRLERMGDAPTVDLTYDPNEVGGDMVVECWISQGPRSTDPGFDPQPGDWVRASDDEFPPRPARVLRRDGNRIWIQFDLPQRAQAVA